jgi:hypothetical protein
MKAICLVLLCLLFGLPSAIALPLPRGSATPPAVPISMTLSSTGVNTNVANNSFATVSVQMSLGSFSGTLAIATHAGCASTNNANFQLSGANLETNGSPNWSSASADNAVCLSATQNGVSFYQSFGISMLQQPGPSAALFANPPYTCVTNYYVTTSGSDSNNGTSLGSAWLTIAHADTLTRSPGDCINVQAGTYAHGNNNLTKGGNAASATGYVTYRCITMNGCTITDTQYGFVAGINSANHPAYLIFDGFTLASATLTNNFAQGFACYNGDTGTVASCHHWIMTNNIVSGYGQSGFQMSDGDYYHAVHNTVFNTSQSTNNGAQGSAISFATEKNISAYTPTAQDLNNPPISIIGGSNPYHINIQWNVIYNAFIGSTSGNTDGECVILDNNGNSATYTSPQIIAFNVCYNSGGRGLWEFLGSHATMANNSVYNTSLDTFDTGTARPGLGSQNAFANVYINNISKAIVPASSPGTLLYNNAFQLDATGGAADTAATNIAFCVNQTTIACATAYNGATFSSVTNKVGTDPGWVNVGNTSTGTESTPPVGANFALSPTSAAIGYGTTEGYLSWQAIDAGACPSLATTCP